MKDKFFLAINALKRGEVVVIPTDTIYGVVAPALNTQSVENLYRIKGRSPEKPFIILISDERDLKDFSIQVSPWQKSIIKKYWPGKVSIIFDCKDNELSYLHRQTNSLAFRLPANTALRELLKKTGPLVAPSANPEGAPPALDIDTAKKYFDGKVKLFISGRQAKKPSTLISVQNDNLQILRKGAVEIEN